MAAIPYTLIFPQVDHVAVDSGCVSLSLRFLPNLHTMCFHKRCAFEIELHYQLEERLAHTEVHTHPLKRKKAQRIQGSYENQKQENQPRCGGNISCYRAVLIDHDGIMSCSVSPQLQLQQPADAYRWAFRTNVQLLNGLEAQYTFPIEQLIA